VVGMFCPCQQRRMRIVDRSFASPTYLNIKNMISFGKGLKSARRILDPTLDINSYNCQVRFFQRTFRYRMPAPLQLEASCHCGEIQFRYLVQSCNVYLISPE